MRVGDRVKGGAESAADRAGEFGAASLRLAALDVGIEFMDWRQR